MDKIKIIIVDDHTLVRQAICGSFKTDNRFDVVADADSGRSAVKLASHHHPDIIVMDVSMPDLNGIETTRQILAYDSTIKVIALSMHSEKVYVTGMLNAGASGYVLKSSSFNELLKCINTVLSGELCFYEEVSHLIPGKDASSDIDNKTSVFSLLSKREIEVLQLITEGNKSRKIAEQLDISVKTVDIHRAKIKTKLGIDNIAGLTRFAIAEGLTSSLL